ncbi:AhpC/TSA antioxidant enzyme-domain-containing protein [Cristinia sonorae]|uniref:AhpC/TSA antioxidant enzyme-domain-containing protein n=1 Tax=Cristinia sonorae TaxID=1940300 RepID=A0A8K0UM51_9AGAR|nr:AhpC/TSA antioxidant enzyme-domain-containing protein [Cristinia sonorae]
MSSLDATTLEQAAKLNVLDSVGQQVPFGSLIEGGNGTIVVFIRHFFCGSCQAYVAQLASVKAEALEKAGKKIVIIGCGDYQPIKNYGETTGYKGPIYADPSRALFNVFGLIQNLETTPKGEQKKSYLTKSYLGNVLSSIWQGPLKSPHHLGKQGNISQLGGDFVFNQDGQCTFASRMKHTEDHVEVADLMREAGVEYP